MSFAVLKKKEKYFPNELSIEVRGQDHGVNFGKIKIFVFMVQKVQVQTCELCGNEKKKKEKNSPTPSTSKSQAQNCGFNFGKIKIFVFYGPTGTGLDLLASRS